MRLLLFDIDGTLIVSGGAGRAAMADAFAAEFGLSGFDGVQVDGRTDTGIFGDALTLAGVDPTPAALDRMTTAYLARSPRRLRATMVASLRASSICSTRLSTPMPWSV